MSHALGYRDWNKETSVINIYVRCNKGKRAGFTKVSQRGMVGGLAVERQRSFVARLIEYRVCGSFIFDVTMPERNIFIGCLDEVLSKGYSMLGLRSACCLPVNFKCMI